MTTIRVNWQKVKESWGTIVFVAGMLGTTVHGIVTVDRYRKLVDEQSQTIQQQNDSIQQLRRDVDHLQGEAAGIDRLRQLLQVTQGRLASLESTSSRASTIPSSIPRRLQTVTTASEGVIAEVRHDRPFVSDLLHPSVYVDGGAPVPTMDTPPPVFVANPM